MVAAVAASIWLLSENDATSRRPASFTELYFADPDSLPSTAPAGQETAISYVIANRSSEPQAYEVVATLGSTEDTTVLSRSSIRVGPGRRTTTSVPFTPAAPGTDHTLTVAIVGGERIHWTVRAV